MLRTSIFVVEFFVFVCLSFGQWCYSIFIVIYWNGESNMLRFNRLNGSTDNKRWTFSEMIHRKWPKSRWRSQSNVIVGEKNEPLQPNTQTVWVREILSVTCCNILRSQQVFDKRKFDGMTGKAVNAVNAVNAYEIVGVLLTIVATFTNLVYINSSQILVCNFYQWLSTEFTFVWKTFQILQINNSKVLTNRIFFKFFLWFFLNFVLEKILHFHCHYIEYPLASGFALKNLSFSLNSLPLQSTISNFFLVKWKKYQNPSTITNIIASIIRKCK